MFLLPQVLDGSDLDAPSLLRVCGNVMPENRTITSTGNTVTVRMKSDGTRSAKGFKASYATVSEQSGPGQRV